MTVTRTTYSATRPVLRRTVARSVNRRVGSSRPERQIRMCSAPEPRGLSFARRTSRWPSMAASGSATSSPGRSATATRSMGRSRSSRCTSWELFEELGAGIVPCGRPCRSQKRVRGVERDRRTAQRRDHPAAEPHALPVRGDRRSGEGQLGGDDRDGGPRAGAVCCRRGHGRREAAGLVPVLDDRAFGLSLVAEVPVVGDGVTGGGQRHVHRGGAENRGRLHADRRRGVRRRDPDEKCETGRTRCIVIRLEP